MVAFRSILFYGLFYLSNALQMIFWLPSFFIMPREEAWKVCKCWAYSHLWLQHKVCGSTYDFRGIERIDPTSSQLIASKHQSAWETYTMILFFDDPGYILKRGLMYVPLFGWFMQKMKVVPVDRGRGALALASMSKNTREQMAERDRQIIIYPEGTRTKPGAELRYKYGIVHLYHELGVTVQPVALNSGLYWGRAAMTIYPGEIVMEFLEPIEPGLSKDAFTDLLRDRIETACKKLYKEAIEADTPTPTAVALSKTLAA